MKLIGSCAFVLLFFSPLGGVTDGANILGIFGSPVNSHQSYFQLIWKELALRGYNVTVFATRPLNDPNIKNLKEIDWGFSFKILEESNIVKAAQTEKNIFKLWDLATRSFINMTKTQFLHPELQDLIKRNNTKFDVVLVEFLHPIFFYMSELFDCPLVIVSSMPLHSLTSTAIGSPLHPLLCPESNLPFGKTLSFKERVMSLLVHMTISVLSNLLYSESNTLIQEVFGVDVNLREIEKKRASLVITNHVPEVTCIHPRMPNVLQIHGLHLTPPAPLKQGIKEFLDSATEGVIYFSLGTFAQSEMIKDQLKLAAEVFSELPYKVVWKLDLKEIEINSTNIFARSFFESQQDILRHPNVKAFITQGGLHSLEEAVAYHVPIIGAPLVGDQLGNVKKMVEIGAGIEINIYETTKDDIKSAILEIMNNPSYMQRIKEIEKYMFDKPMKPMDEIVWWLEYVIRHKGAYHMKSPYHKLTWNEYYLFDVILIIIVALVSLIFVTYKVLKIVLYKVLLLRKRIKSKKD